MTRLLQLSGGILVDWLAQSNRRSATIALADGSAPDAAADDTPSQRLDHPTYLRRGILIAGMALPAMAPRGFTHRPSTH